MSAAATPATGRIGYWHDALAQSLERAVNECAQRTAELRGWQALLARAPIGNAPTATCKAVLNAYGFCVLTRDQVQALEVTLNLQLAEKDIESEEAKRLDELLGQVENELALAVQR